MLRAIALIAGLIIAGTVHAQEFADFDWKLSKIFIAAPEFAGVVPSTAKRRPEGVGGGPGRVSLWPLTSWPSEAAMVMKL